MLMNEADTIRNIRESTGLLSTKTLLANHPWVTDPQEELDLILAERKAELDDCPRPLPDDDLPPDEGDDE